MSLTKIFLEYVVRDEGQNFKGMEYYKHYLPKSSMGWIEDEIKDNLNKGVNIEREVKFIDTTGSQYLRLYTEDGKHGLILRLSTHEENKNVSKNADYHIETWLNSDTDIKREINKFIDIAVMFFNTLHKREEEKDLTKQEKKVLRIGKSDEAFNEVDRYQDLDIIHRNVTKKKMNNQKPNYIKLP